jgi:histidine kinase
MNTGSVIEVTQRWQAARSLLGTSPLRLSQLRAALLLVALAGTTVLVMYLAAREAGNWLLQEEAAQLRPHLSLYASALEGQIEHYRALPAVLALDPDLHTALTGGLDSERRKRLNLKLESVNGAATTSTLTLLDGGGHCIAASNWSLPQSNVGHDYSFRPYFRQLANHDDGSFYGVGHTTGIPGYFLSKALRETSGKLIGALVIKLDLRDVERQWLRSTHTVLVTDPNGVVFLASNPAWRYRVLTALTASQRSELEATQQFASQALRPVHGLVIENLGDDGRRVQFDEAGIAGDYLWQSLPLAREGWTLHALDNMRSGTAVARIAELAAAGIWLSLVFFALFLRQRMRTSRLRQRSREELEELVRQHTAALRTAQDGLVQAANLANLGHAESLEHLPQGVSVVDAELRLTAWNHRYVELFRLPSDLMRAGRPIEDILRHNARRGLMGTGDVEDAVRRRIEHLRAGHPYRFERERPDGTVLEIRGNPLPGGGFVTSYADITAYKSAARDLRTLATTLELRVEQRTQELQEAKRDAERANRSKTRFVTAAVHDLQQPLHAARLYVSAVLSRLTEPESLELARNVEESLAAQDAILSSLLDISRLESGSMPTQVRDLPIAALFEALGREFGILAQAKGLELRCFKTRVVGRSDEALLRRILQNFLSNAIRYTRRGEVLLGCRRRGDALRIEVWDTGPGIPECHWKDIFEEFRRLDDAVEQAQGGTGLGLAIVDRTARLLGHSVGLRSWVGRGSMFSLTLPIGDAACVVATPKGPPPQDDSVLHGRSVWCVDDDPRVRDAVRALLEHWGCRVFTAGSAADGAQLAAVSTAPDLLILDYHFGERTGPEILRELCERWSANPPVILVTAERNPALEEEARSRGWGFLHKPLRPPSLRALMKQLLIRGQVH